MLAVVGAGVLLYLASYRTDSQDNLEKNDIIDPEFMKNDPYMQAPWTSNPNISEENYLPYKRGRKNYKPHSPFIEIAQRGAGLQTKYWEEAKVRLHDRDEYLNPPFFTPEYDYWGLQYTTLPRKDTALPIHVTHSYTSEKYSPKMYYSSTKEPYVNL